MRADIADTEIVGLRHQVEIGRVVVIVEERCLRAVSPLGDVVEHHRTGSLLDEYRRLLREHDAAYDERYLA